MDQNSSTTGNGGRVRGGGAKVRNAHTKARNGADKKNGAKGRRPSSWRSTATPPVYSSSINLNCSMHCMPCRRAIFQCVCPAIKPASPARFATHSTPSSPPTSASRNSSSTSAKWSVTQGKTRTRVRFGLSDGAWADMESSVNALIDDLVVADHCGDPHRDRGGARRPAADRASGCRWPAAEGRVPAFGQHRQHDDQAAQRVHLRSHARGARGGHRRQAGRPGAGARGDRRLEGPDRKRELNGVESDCAGAQYRRGDHRRGQRRLVEENHRRRARRDSAVEGSHQYHGGSAALLRLRGHARGA